MAPKNLTDCLLLFARLNTTQATTLNTTSIYPNKEDNELQALLYIVITLLFYSLGITVGIISYLKRERQEMEEDRVYDQFIATRQDPIWSSKYEKVQQVISRLQFLENEKLSKNKTLSTDREREILIQNDQLLEINSEQIEEDENIKSNRIIHFKSNVKSKDSSDSTTNSRNDNISEQSTREYNDEPHRNDQVSNENNSQLV